MDGIAHPPLSINYIHTNMITPKISIIIPVYNKESYLNRSLDSVLEQTFADWECLLIDDGSLDRSGFICDDYSKRDKRFIVVHKENGGVSSARNCGLENAKGEYIFFMDADDEIAPDTLEKNQTLLAKNPDLLEYPITYKYNTDSPLSKKSEYLFLHDSYAIQDFVFNNNRNEVCGYFFHSSFIGNHRFREDIAIGEDLFFMITLLPYCQKFIASPYGSYLAYVTPRSAMTSLSMEQQFRKRLWLLNEILSLPSSYGALKVDYLYMEIKNYILRKNRTAELQSLVNSFFTSASYNDIWASHLTLKARLLLVFYKMLFIH